MDEVIFCSRGQEFGTLEFIFDDEEMVYAISTLTINLKKWTSIPIYRRMMTIRVGAIPPSVKPEWILAAVFNDIEDEYNVHH